MKKLVTLLGIFLSVAFQAHAVVDIKEIISPGGIKAWLVEDHSIPFLALRLVFRGGSRVEPDSLHGASYLMTGLLNEGAGDLEAAEFQKQEELLAAEFEFDSYRDNFYIKAKFLTENRDESVELLRLALTSPRFDEEPVERIRSQVLASIAAREKDPAEIAADSLFQLTFGDHEYGRPVEGSVATVSAITQDDLRESHRRLFVRSQVFVGAAGDITAEELGRLLDRLLGDLPESGPALPPEPAFLLTPGESIIDFPSAQTVVLFGHKGLRRRDPDFLAAYVLNQIVGGSGFKSRLMKKVRENRGLTYGISSFLASLDQAALFIGNFSSTNEVVEEAVEVVRQIWDSVATQGITQEELDYAKTYLTGAYALRFDGNSAIAAILAGMQIDDLPIDYVKTRNDMVMALTLEDINEVATQMFRPEELHFVLVGQPVGQGDE